MSTTRNGPNIQGIQPNLSSSPLDSKRKVLSLEVDTDPVTKNNLKDKKESLSSLQLVNLSLSPNDSPRVDKPLICRSLDKSSSETKDEQGYLDKSSPEIKNEKVQNISVNTHEEHKQKSLQDSKNNNFFQLSSETIWGVLNDHSEFKDRAAQFQVFKSASKEESNEGGFEIFGLSRLEAITLLCDKYAKDSVTVSDGLNKSIQVREMASYEIRQAFLEDKLPAEMRTPDSLKLKKQLEEAKQRFEITLKEMTAHCGEKKGGFSSLAEVMFCLHKSNKMSGYKELLEAKRAWAQTEILLDHYCQSPTVFENYLKSYYIKEKGQLRCLYDSEHRPIPSMLDVVSMYMECNLVVFTYNKVLEENKDNKESQQTDAMVPIHLFGEQYTKTLYVGYQTNRELSPGSYVLLQLLKETNKQPAVVPKIAQEFYRVNLRAMEKEQWQDRWYHEALDAILSGQKDPSSLQLLEVLIGPTNNHHVMREVNALTFDQIRNQQKYVLYLAVYEIISRVIRVEYQECVFDTYKKHLNQEEEKSINKLRRKLAIYNKELEGIQDKINHGKGDQFNEIRRNIKVLEEKKKAIVQKQEEKGAQSQVAKLDELIAIKKEELASMTPYYQERKLLLERKQRIEDNIIKCNQKWSQAKERLKLTMGYLRYDSVVSQYRMEIVGADSVKDPKSNNFSKKTESNQDKKWVVSQDYEDALAQYIYQTGQKKESEPERKKGSDVNGSEAKDAPSLTRLNEQIEKEKARLEAKKYLSDFAHYETYLPAASFAVKNSKELKVKIQEKLRELCQTLAVESASLLGNMLSHDPIKRREGIENLRLAFVKRFRKICEELYGSSDWIGISPDTDLVVWNNKFKKLVEEAWEIWKKSEAKKTEALKVVEGSVNDPVKDFQRNDFASVDEIQYKEKTEIWLKTQIALVQQFVPGKTQEEGIMYLVNLGCNMRTWDLDQIVDHPRSGHTLMHWVGLQLEQRSEKEPGLNHLVEVACSLLKRGVSLVRYQNDAKNEEVGAENGQKEIVLKIDFRNYSAKQIWKLILVHLENFLSRCEVVENLRSVLVQYAKYTNLVLNGTWSDMPLGTFLYSYGIKNETKNLEMRLVGRLIYSMIESTEQLTDEPILSEIASIKQTPEVRGFWQKIKTMFDRPDGLLNQINKVFNNTQMIVLRLDASVERNKKEEAIMAKVEAERRVKEETERRIQAEKKQKQAEEKQKQAEEERKKETELKRQAEETVKQLEEELRKRDSSPNVSSGFFQQRNGLLTNQLSNSRSVQPNGSR